MIGISQPIAGHMADIFISYASADRERAGTLAEAFAGRGHSVWWDRTIPPGRVFDEVIQEALDAARCVVVLWSATSVRSNWVKAEASEALARNKLVPVLTDQALPPFEFKRIQAANLAGWSGDPRDPEFTGLLASVDRLVAQPPRPAATHAVPTVEPRPRAVGSQSRWAVVALVAVVVLAGAAYVSGIIGGAKDDPRAKLVDDATKGVGQPSAVEPSPGRINLLAAENGGELLTASGESWTKTVDGDEGTFGIVGAGDDATLGFREGRAATFDTIALLIPSASGQNVRQFELLAGHDGPLGAFRSVGVFTTANMLMVKSPFQPFTFPPVTARVVKIRVLSGQKPNLFIHVHEVQLFGRLVER